MALVKLDSGNRKLGAKVSATYVAEQTCPRDCALLGVCYGRFYGLGWVWRRVNREASKRSALAEIRDEATKLSALPDGRTVRLHVVGDCPSDAGAGLLAHAAKRLRAFSYTHSWRSVRRSSWGTVSVLASCETTADVKAAHRRGYAAALVVPDFPSERAFHLDGIKVVPCPEMTGRAPSCEACGLCLNDGLLKTAGIVIGFRPHGPRANQTRRLLGDRQQ